MGNKEELMSQKELVYDYIVRYSKQFGYAPTRREISDHTVTSPGRLTRVLDDLQDAGYLLIERRKPRAIKLIKFKLVEK